MDSFSCKYFLGQVNFYEEVGHTLLFSIFCKKAAARGLFNFEQTSDLHDDYISHEILAKLIDSFDFFDATCNVSPNGLISRVH